MRVSFCLLLLITFAAEAALAEQPAGSNGTETLDTLNVGAMVGEVSEQSKFIDDDSV